MNKKRPSHLRLYHGGKSIQREAQKAFQSPEHSITVPQRHEFTRLMLMGLTDRQLVELMIDQLWIPLRVGCPHSMLLDEVMTRLELNDGGSREEEPSPLPQPAPAST